MKKHTKTGQSRQAAHGKPYEAKTSRAAETARPAGRSRRRPDAAITTAGTAEDVRVGDRLVVTVKRLGINGEGVGYFKRKAVFIPGALPDEVVKARVTKVEPTYLHAALVDIEKKSPHRQKPECPVYETCGGCQLQHMSYEGQLRAKEELVRESFHRYVGDEPIEIRPIYAMNEPWGYRNKAQMQVGSERGTLITGLYSPGTHKLVDISGCKIQHPVINEVVQKVREIAAELSLPAYNENTGSGLLRTIVARVARQTNEVQLTLVTAKPHLPNKDELISRIRNELPMVVTIAQNINSGDTPLVFGEKTIVLWGREHIRETLGGLKFDLSPRAFFQLNPEQTVKLYEAVAEAADLQGRELVVDAYCGTGTIALWLAPHAAEVRGIEVVPEAVADARRNAEASGIANARFFLGCAEQLLPQWVAEGVRPDVVVVDPPRTGCDAQLLKAIIRARPARMVYVSCNPATLAKDCKVLTGGGFHIEWVQPVDMFPQTAHVECCVLLVRK